ncbi:hypothetical protein LXL04_007513 [Taraxacum kok-saghyz]
MYRIGTALFTYFIYIYCEISILVSELKSRFSEMKFSTGIISQASVESTVLDIWPWRNRGKIRFTIRLCSAKCYVPVAFHIYFRYAYFSEFDSSIQKPIPWIVFCEGRWDSSASFGRSNGKKKKCVFLWCMGLDNSGKTTIVLKINGEDTSVISPTLGFNIKTMTYDKYTLNIWDVGGQKTIRSYWRNYFEQTDGLVWVVDSSDLRRLDDCKYELDNLLKEERLSGASLLVFANKQDIQGALSPNEIAKVLNLDAMDKTRHWRIVGCSAYTGEGLLEGFDWLVQDIASRIYVLD